MQISAQDRPRRILVSEANAHVGETVRVCGWVKTLRLQKMMQFVVLHDETGSLQIVHPRSELGGDLENAIDGLTIGSAVGLTGAVVAAPQVKLGGIELQVISIDELSLSEPSPISDDSGPDLRMDWRFLDLRNLRQHLIFKVWDTLEQGLRAYLKDNRFTELHTPKLMGAASEGGAEVFRVDYFGSSAFLAQSPQFYKQMAIAAGFERVMEVGPVFRAEPSFTSRHSTEFTGFDLEMAWIASHEEVMELEACALAHAIEAVRQRHADEIQDVFGITVSVPTLPFPRITLREARELIAAAGWEPGPNTTTDLDGNGERMLSALIAERDNHEFVFVTEYPVSVRPFYHMRTPEDPSLTRSFDLLWNGLEVTTGAQREHRYSVLSAQADEKGVDLGTIADYANCFRYGVPPHGGVGIGLNRLVMKILGLDSIRDASLFFRGPTRLTP